MAGCNLIMHKGKTTWSLNYNQTATIPRLAWRSLDVFCNFTDGDPLNGRKGLGYTFGFRYDGYVDYEDLTQHPNQAIRELAELEVFPDPKITTFIDSIGSEFLVSLWSVFNISSYKKLILYAHTLTHAYLHVFSIADKTVAIDDSYTTNNHF